MSIKITRRTTLALWLVASGGCASAQEPFYQVGEAVELKASGNHWQKCTVTDPGSPERVMRLRCDAYEGAGYSRGGGVYTESPNSTGVRRAAPPSPPAAAPDAMSETAARAEDADNGGSYQVGQAVELEASKHWVPCVVSEIQMIDGRQLIRARCSPYPALSRGAGIYLVHDNENGIRPATGQIGPASPPAEVARQSPGPGSTLRAGEYACYGAGQRIMAGLKFNITGPAQYTDAYGAAGSYRIDGTNVVFSGGALSGMTGRNLTNRNGFTIGSQASCEFFG